MNHLPTLCLAVFGLGTSLDSAADDLNPATRAVNALGLDLLAKGPGAGENALLSPYSIQAALAMVFAGAGG